VICGKRLINNYFVVINMSDAHDYEDISFKIQNITPEGSLESRASPEAAAKDDHSGCLYLGVSGLLGVFAVNVAFCLFDPAVSTGSPLTDLSIALAYMTFFGLCATAAYKKWNKCCKTQSYS
jgi:hypothetical protein